MADNSTSPPNEPRRWRPRGAAQIPILTCRGWESAIERPVSGRWRPAMRQQLRDLAGRLHRQPLQHVSQVGIRVKPIELGRLDEADHGRSPLARAQAADEQPVLPPQRNGTNVGEVEDDGPQRAELRAAVAPPVAALIGIRTWLDQPVFRQVLTLRFVKIVASVAASYCMSVFRCTASKPNSIP